ncbi:unnamed protein product [Urochloa decumbens]|uniref:Leucine-rich repeat-containing N-terminal plant-type domain-containing protein n=1 Tax=Urochloa decumbens TaxID=240449 RepID=A0ABC8Z1S6_9POAL
MTMANHGPRPVVLHLVLLQIQLAVAVCPLLPPSTAASYTSNHTTAAARAPSVPCLPDQASALLRLKRSFITTDYSVVAFRSWRAGTDCCRWLGVRCGDADGRVTSLDLGDCNLYSGHLDSAVFELSSLRYLNLGGNYFNESKLPSSGFERLTKLTNLNLSSSNFGGEVPHGIGRLTNLVSLDLSARTVIDYLPGMGFHYHAETAGWLITLPNVTTLVANLGSLRELRLGFVYMFQSEEWCEPIAKHTPNLRVLSLPFCFVSGPICRSLSALHSLSVIDLQYNSLTGPIPDFFANFSFLSVIQLSYNNLEGMVSPAIFQHKKLVTINLHRNFQISGSLPNFSADSCLQDLVVGYTNFSGTIPSSIGNIKSLMKLGLDAPGFSGNLPSSIGRLKSLNELRVSGLDLVGSIPSWIANLTSLEVLQFSTCGLDGSIPSYLGGLSKLRTLALYHCKFSGDISTHISNLTQVEILDLGSNNFTGMVELNSLWKLPNLSVLNLSNNKIVVVDGEQNSSSMVSYPNIMDLRLASCSIKNFPSILRHLNEIGGLDLSDNQIYGAIPQWVWETLSNHELSFLDFSRNKLTNIGYDDTFLPIYIDTLNLSSNMFEGTIPLPQYSTFELDYSNNMFSSMPLNISSQLEQLTVFRASRNNLSGNLSPFFCSRDLQILDLSYNIFNGAIPSCLIQDANSLKVLNLRENQLYGELPRYITENCTLEMLDLSGNRIEGRLPKSLASCKMLEVLDIGNNEIGDSFPCWMSTLPKLQVLVLKYNKFFGQIEPSVATDKITCEFPSVRILDLASNNFSGTLTEEWFSTLMAMMIANTNETLVMEYTGYQGELYQVATVLTYKGSEVPFEKILRTLAFLDVSNNALQGRIPENIGELVLLLVVNMSHNSFTGPIPPQLGHLRQLESLDLSSNELSGEIPQELASLDFLTVLNLSENKLLGPIPKSPQFMTFSSSSFVGNDGLCGPPLSKECINTTTPTVTLNYSKKKSVDIISFFSAGLGFGVGFAIAIVVAWVVPIRKRS